MSRIVAKGHENGQKLPHTNFSSARRDPIRILADANDKPAGKRRSFSLFKRALSNREVLVEKIGFLRKKGNRPGSAVISKRVIIDN